MKKLIIIILFVLMYACQENKVDLLKEGTIIISGKIDNTSKTPHNVVSIIIENIISGKQQTITEKLNSNGEFLIRSNIYHSQDVFFKYGNALKPMLLNPGDSIYVSFDALRLDRTITYTGESAETNNQLNIFFNKFSDYFIKNDDVTSKITKYSPLKYKKAVYLQQIRYDSIFKDFKKEITPNNEVTLWVKNYLKYRCGDDLISIARFPDIEIPKEYWRFTDEYELNNNAALNCTQYQDYVRDYYSICFSRKQNHIREAIKAFNKNNYYSYLSIATDLIMRNFRGISRDLILSYVLYSALDNDYLAVDSVLNNKDMSFETKQFRRRIEKEVEKYQLIDYKNMEGINTCNDTCNNFLLNLIQTKYKNKVVYIDIWGTWCPHCFLILMCWF